MNANLKMSNSKKTQFSKSGSGKQFSKKDIPVFCHYTHATTDWLEANHILFVPRQTHCANVPQTRLSKHFWALLERKLYSNRNRKLRIKASCQKLFLKIKTGVLGSIFIISVDLPANSLKIFAEHNTVVYRKPIAL